MKNTFDVKTIRQVLPSIIASQIVGVQPMTGPIGYVFPSRYQNKSLRDECKLNGDKCSFRTRNGRVYVTIIVGASAGKVYQWEKVWQNELRLIVGHQYPNAIMTSGSSKKATFFLGTVFDLMKGQSS